ncbi:MAG TPA: heme ABC exporter ATP-binding protein CcmA [Acidimicrobiales bacterium]|nr:heme ABC exporter ATP-binding protein CcmA [Acidimicrobiales bacterium]
MAHAVSLHSAVALIGRFPALAGADLTVDAGEVVLVRGANGAGKTTLLRVCAGLLAVSAGDARVLGHDLRRDRRSVRCKVAFLAHDAALYDDLTVAENLRFGVRSQRGDMTAIDVAQARLGLDGRLCTVPVGRLSTGQRRRVALALLVARRSPLWLLDEPHAGLDAATRDLIDALIREAAADGVTVLLASHEVDRAGALASRQVVVAGGQVVAMERSEATDVS